MVTIRVGFIFSASKDASLVGEIDCLPQQRFAQWVLGAAVTAGFNSTGGEVQMDDIPRGLRKRRRMRIDVAESVRDYLVSAPDELRGLLAVALLKAGWEARLMYRPGAPSDTE